MNYVDNLSSRGAAEARQNAQRRMALRLKGVSDRGLRVGGEQDLQDRATSQVDAADRFRHDYPLIVSRNNGQKTA